MGRTASPATPGTDPIPKNDDDLAKDALNAGALAAAATSEAGDLQAKVDAQAKDIADLRALVHTMSRNQVAQAMPEKVELPDLDDVMKKKPTISVLTKQGWYVPPKLDSQQVKG